MDLTEASVPEELNRLTDAVIGGAVEVHRKLGPGLLESVYQEALVLELEERDLQAATEVDIPVIYKEHKLGARYRIDIFVADSLVVEVKALERVRPVHRAQLLTYLRLADCRIGLLLNFHEARLVDGVHRVVL